MIIRAWDAAGHVAVWTGLYTAACVVVFGQFSGVSLRPSWASLGMAFTAGQTLYLLDRVKLSDRLLDPADAAANPARFAFVARHARTIRALMVLLGLVSLGLAFAVSPLLPPVLVLGGCCMIWYAGRPAPRAAKSGNDRRSRRPKDIYLLKNLIIAGGLCGFAGAVVLLDAARSWESALLLMQNEMARLLLASLSLFTLVLGDSIACDIEDVEADRAFGTRTVPGRWNTQAGWWVSGGLTCFAACISGLAIATRPAAAATSAAEISPALRGLAWSLGLILSFAWVCWRRRERPRDAIDLRLPLLTLLLGFLPMLPAWF